MGSNDKFFINRKIAPDFSYPPWTPPGQPFVPYHRYRNSVAVPKTPDVSRNETAVEWWKPTTTHEEHVVLADENIKQTYEIDGETFSFEDDNENKEHTKWRRSTPIYAESYNDALKTLRKLQNLRVEIEESEGTEVSEVVPKMTSELVVSSRVPILADVSKNPENPALNHKKREDRTSRHEFQDTSEDMYETTLVEYEIDGETFYYESKELIRDRAKTGRRKKKSHKGHIIPDKVQLSSESNSTDALKPADLKISEEPKDEWDSWSWVDESFDWKMSQIDADQIRSCPEEARDDWDSWSWVDESFDWKMSEFGADKIESISEDSVPNDENGAAPTSGPRRRKSWLRRVGDFFLCRNCRRRN